MWRLFFAFIAAAALLYGGLHYLGRHDRMAARAQGGRSAAAEATTASAGAHPASAVVEN